MMSVQFGRWNLDGRPVALEYVEKVSATLAPYGPDSKSMYSKEGTAILYHAFHTSKESRYEKQPHTSQHGVITWDGRLDNRNDLVSELDRGLSANSTDVEVVAAAFERWGTKCLGKLIGDWALSVWNPDDCSLLLARDPVGIRHLHYIMEKDYIAWSTTLDPLVLFAGRTFELSEECVAGWLFGYPSTCLTPYVGVRSVPPSSSVLIQPGKHKINMFWDFDSAKTIGYRSDAEYEEHFRAAFAKAVQRRLRCDTPVLAELSGGRDSSSIVCMADMVIAQGKAECPRLDTISLYDDSEPNWNERPYFTQVEEKRGRTGWHVNVGPQDSEKAAEPTSLTDSFSLRFSPGPHYPGYDGRTALYVRACLGSQGNRVLLSGTGGDEVMGGVPNPVSELQDLIATWKFGALAHGLKVWPLEKRIPWFYLFRQVISDFFPVQVVGAPKQSRPAPWLNRRFVRRNWNALHGYPSRTRLFGPLPSFQANMATLEALRRQLACAALPFDPTYEKRYPFLDRDLMEFVFATPREQLVRPGQRRSLMRRALVGIVPDGILNRKTKAFVERAQHVEISRDFTRLTKIAQDMVSSSLHIVDPAKITQALQKARSSDATKEVPIIPLMRTFLVEGWLEVLRASGIVNVRNNGKPKLVLQTTTQG